MKFAAGSAHWEISEVALSQAIFAAMQVYIPWLAASRGPLADLAMLSLAQSVVWPLAMITQMQLRTIYVVEGERALLPLFVQLRLVGCVFLVASAAIAASMLRSSPLLLSLAVALALVKCVENVADIVHGELQRAMEVSRAARSQTYRCAIFIGVYTVGMVSSGQLLVSLVAALAATAGWVVAVDLRCRGLWRDLLTHTGNLDHVGPTLKAGICLSTAVALSSLAVMAGRWAAMRASDMEALAAAALAGTMASIVALVLGATQQFCFAEARAQLGAGGTAAFRHWCSMVTRRLHLGFAGLTLVWLAGAILSYDFTLPLPGTHFGGSMQKITVTLAGFFLAAGWLAVLCFPDTLLLILKRRYVAVLLIGLLQVAGAVCVSFLLYPLFGWLAIGAAELVRGSLYFVAVRYSGQKLQAA